MRGLAHPARYGCRRRMPWNLPRQLEYTTILLYPTREHDLRRVAAGLKVGEQIDDFFNAKAVEQAGGHGGGFAEAIFLDVALVELDDLRGAQGIGIDPHRLGAIVAFDQDAAQNGTAVLRLHLHVAVMLGHD